MTHADGRVKAGVWENDEYFGTKAEWDAKVAKEKLAEEQERLAEKKT